MVTEHAITTAAKALIRSLTSRYGKDVAAALSAEELASPKVIDYIQGATTLWKAERWSGLRVRAVDGIQARRLLATIAKPLSVRQGAMETMGAGKAQWILWD